MSDTSDEQQVLIKTQQEEIEELKRKVALLIERLYETCEEIESVKVKDDAFYAYRPKHWDWEWDE